MVNGEDEFDVENSRRLLAAIFVQAFKDVAKGYVDAYHFLNHPVALTWVGFLGLEGEAVAAKAKALFEGKAKLPLLKANKKHGSKQG